MSAEFGTHTLLMDFVNLLFSLFMLLDYRKPYFIKHCHRCR